MRKLLVALSVAGLFVSSIVLGGRTSNFHNFPQIGDGGGIQSAFLVTNQNDQEATVRISFIGDNGSPMDLETNVESGHTIEFKVPANGMRRIVSSGTSDPVRTGWARLVSSLPVAAQVLFEIQVDGKLVTQAAVDSANPTFQACVFTDQSASSRTGVAMASLSEVGKTRVVLTLRDEEGNASQSSERILEPLQHEAKFLGELFDEVEEGRGTLCIGSSNRILLVALQQTGLVIGTLSPIIN